MSSRTGFLLVRAGRRRVGLQLADVLAVVPLGTVHPVPAIEPAIRGVVEIHGRMTAVVHLGALLDGEAFPPHPATLGVLVSVEAKQICLEVEDAEILAREPSLPVPPGEALPWAIGVARYSDELVPLLDIPTISSRLMEAVL